MQAVNLLDAVDDLLEEFARFFFLQSLVFDNLVEQFSSWCLLNKQK